MSPRLHHQRPPGRERCRRQSSSSAPPFIAIMAVAAAHEHHILQHQLLSRWPNPCAHIASRSPVLYARQRPADDLDGGVGAGVAPNSTHRSASDARCDNAFHRLAVKVAIPGCRGRSERDRLFLKPSPSQRQRIGNIDAVADVIDRKTLPSGRSCSHDRFLYGILSPARQR